MTTDTIAAVATPPGKGGVGIVRISGPQALTVAEAIIGFTPKPRHAHYCDFIAADKTLIDQGIALYFPNPHSFTGEDVFELQGHGGPVILDLLLETALQHGARLAKPGEFSERAFLNDKIDLLQAEAIADLIDATTKQAAKNASNTIKGAFSQRIDKLEREILHLRMFVESAIDFPEEEIDFLADSTIVNDLETAINHTQTLLKQSEQGSLIKEGLNVVIAGRPNAGKSSLLNALAEKDLAIVTNVEGTTRDVIREHIQLDGIPLHIIDTAGLRDTPDEVEKVGIQRAWQEIQHADLVLLMIDSTDEHQRDVEKHWPEFFNNAEFANKVLAVFNKYDLSQFEPTTNPHYESLSLSVKSAHGLERLKNKVKSIAGIDNTIEGGFSARRRHVDALHTALEHMLAGKTQLIEFKAGELLAEELKLAHDYIGEITGKTSPDDLLGKIFASFCIGK